MMTPCVFCEALTKESHRVIHQDAHVFVLLNIEPVKDGHLMVLPIRHAEELKDLTHEEARAFLQAIDRCMGAVTKTFDDEPMCMVNGWKYRSQPHLHAHVLPSKHSLRGLYVAAEGVAERQRAEDEALKRVAEQLRPFFQDGTS
jgi:histidine triad (HIT) family protein